MTRDLVILIALLVPGSALAQAQIQPPKAFTAVDANGVDLTSGTMVVNAPTIAIGPQDGGLVYSRSLDTTTNIWRDNYIGTVNTDPLHPVPENPTVTVTVMGQTIRFSQLSSGYEPVDDYAALTKSGTTWTLTLSDGSVALFSQTLASSGIYTANGGRITSLTRPNGEVLTFTYATAPTGVYDQYRLQSVTTNRGYQLHFDYAANGSTWTTDWDRVTTVTALNNAYDACAPTALSCSYSRTWPNLVFGTATNEQNVTDALLRTTRYNFNGVGANGGLLIGIRKPSNSGSLYDLAIGWTFDTPSQAWRVTSVTNRDNRTWSYAYGPGPSDPPPSDYTTTVTTTDPLTHTQVVGIQSMQFDTTTSHRVTRIAYATNGVGKTTTYDNHGVLYKIKRITQPEGDRVDYGFDPRGNITSAVRTNKAGSATISQGATYPGTCVSPDNPKTCNKPITVTDGRGAVTDFTYDTTHGGVLTATAPAPTGGAVRPQTRYSYGSGYAWYKYAGGPIAQGPSPISVPTGTSACATLTTCAGGADEVKTTIAYEAGSGSVATNLLPISTTSGDGAGTLSATTAMTYNARSDVITVNGPIAGSADTTRSFFDSMRQKNGEIRADPDGGGTLLFPATRTTFNLDGQVSLVETGTTTSQSDMASFAMLEQTQTDYDLIGRKTKASFYGGGATQTVSEFGYDIANRLTCSTVRMNPSTFGLSPDACTLRTAGFDGPDRITYISYDNANRPTQVQSGYGTAAVRTEQTTTYTDNGKEQTVADGKSNLTTYEYDGFDRLQKVRYPNPTGSGSSTTDFDLYGYDANDNRTSWQRRGQTSPVTFSFDALNRQTSGLRGETYAYDNVSRRTSASLSGASVTLGYDALGRVLTETAYGYAMAYQYDLAGNRTRITWPDSVFVTYDYDNLYRTTAAKESGASTLVGVAYDNLGRRTALTRLNGVTTSYGYDNASRLSSIFHDLAGGSTNDLTITMAYTPASQIRTKTGSNSLYDWTGAQLTGTYTANGLNQYSAAGSRAPTYDARGNTANDGVNGFTYDIANNLSTSTAGGGTTVAYDPAGRLRSISQGGGTTSLAYSGVDIVSEFDNSGTLFRRYVPGPNPDEHWIWYNGVGTGDRRYYLQDQISSVIGLADNSGAAYAINAYDEYGVPRSGNQGRYQYTGQAWGASLGFYSFKSRMYHPTLGRFLQTDPIEYGDGLNWYAYVGNDPVNFSDPTGLQVVATTTCVTGGATGGPEEDVIVGGCKTSYSGKIDQPEQAPPPPIFTNLNNAEDACRIDAAITPDGDTKGDNPRRQGGRYNTDLQGGWADAQKVFSGLSILADQPYPTGSLNPLDGGTIAVSSNPITGASGAIRLRLGLDYKGGATVGVSPRIDIQAGVFGLTKAETIHFRGGKGNMCPSK